MQATAVSVLLVVSTFTQYNYRTVYQPAYVQPRSVAGAIKQDELEYQQKAFQQWWGSELVTRLDDLPAEGKVADYRIPYAGHDYPDRGGGTINAMVKYDRAFHYGRMLAADFERRDIEEHRNAKQPEYVRGLFGRTRVIRHSVPTWYGHCNGWTAAAIRHAEPQKSVVRNGVVFTPADIKGLLAELYMYADTEFLGGVDPAINPGTLHITLANWVGRGSYPIGMETAVGEVVINFPLFSYKATVNKFAPRQAEVRNIVTYAVNTPREYDQQPANYHRTLYFHYVLDLDDQGEIRGGRYYGDSGQIDMLWAPLKPAQGGDERNQRGNPHLSVREVLAIWRESVPEDLRTKWLNIDPTDEDRVLSEEELRALAEREAPPMPPEPPAAEADVAASASENGSAAPARDVTTEPEGPEPATDDGLAEPEVTEVREPVEAVP
jgi:hypothetical protein